MRSTFGQPSCSRACSASWSTSPSVGSPPCLSGFLFIERIASAVSKGNTALLAGRAAFSMFIFLEVLDATFSFDGVIGAFAITPDPLIIMMGLGVGALAVRSMTIYLVREGTLAEYRYLEHGAHWAIGALAVMLLLTIKYHLGEFVIGGIGIAFILAAWLTSIRANKREALEAAEESSTTVKESQL